ncbi:YEATS domain containing 2 homolog D12 [Xylocopa sonorina]|uniref:YEATS domain containing 2 homolog D12 n=1 Tax=Xylocopa sonorina TaxID=1818115 RepID=UPI00403AF558
MSAIKDQDPDYGPSAATNEKHRRIYEENARSCTAKKITAIIEKEFSLEIDAKEKEVLEIQERLHKASKVLHLLRYVIVADFYNRKQCQNPQIGEAKQTQIHPAIKQLISKSPKLQINENYSTLRQSLSTSPFDTNDPITVKTEKLEKTSEHYRTEKRGNETDEDSRPKKIPRYIPPKSGIPETECPSRGIRHKVRKRIIIGNISKWIPPEWREDAASHKWTMYVRGNKENPDIDDFVSKVRFFLHPSYRPNDVVEVSTAPFCLSRRGWGEFPLRVQLHFKSAFNKPMDVIHHLKLDRTYTGLQTLGSETLVDIWIYTHPQNFKRNASKIIDQDINETENDCKVKLENDEDANITSNLADKNVSEALLSTNMTCNVLIKREPLEDININRDSVNEKKLQFYVELDHDYCGSKYLNNFDKNLTLDHSSTALIHDLSLKDSPVYCQQEETKRETIEGNNILTGEISMNENLNDLKLKELMDETVPSSNEHNGNMMRVLPSSCTKVHSNIRPLEITIPPLFEPSGNKHVLVLQNNKTISVDIAVPSMEDFSHNSTNDSVKPKMNLSTTSRGISLLKKPLGSETTIQVQNPNGTKSQRGLKLRLSKSILLNVKSNVPVLKIADERNLSNHHRSNSEREPIIKQTLKSNKHELTESKLLRQKITLGKDKHKIQSKREFYDKIFRAIEIVSIKHVQGLLRFIIKRMPMITQDAFDSDYKRLHPYACATEEEYFSYTIAKRNACEWNRARMIQCFLKKKPIPEEELWTTKEIMIWARLHGYTPLCPDFTIHSIKQLKSLPDSAVINKNISTCTEPHTFYKWLQMYPGRSNDRYFDGSHQFNELNLEIDVVHIDNAPENRKGLKEGEGIEDLANTKVTILELETKLMPLYDFVCETAREIGIGIISEEIVPTVVHGAAGRMIMRAIECLVEDLVRMSLARAWERCSDHGYPKMIVLEDVRCALLSREEFDVFTNRGLGSKYRFTVMD